jgi:phosphatidate cytidylyltransferase
MHLKRWLTGIIAIPILIYIVGFGPRWLMYSLILLFSIIGLLEYFRITSPGLPTPIKIVCLTFTFFLFYFIARGPFFMILAVASLWLIIPFSLLLFFYPAQRDHALEQIGKIVFGLLYICLPLGLLIFIDKHPRGNIWIFFLLFVIFMTDTGAFYFGRIFGKHKLYPSVSPGKTWEGAIGGFLCSLIAVLIFSFFFPVYRLNVSIWVLAASLSILSQVGDLAESLLKRIYGVKDSGKILPGHGGVLDRIDGLLFAIPALYIFLSWSISQPG